MSETILKQIQSLYTPSAITGCAIELSKDKEATSFEMSAGELYIEEEEFQVIVKVTRNQEEFLGVFDKVKTTTVV